MNEWMNEWMNEQSKNNMPLQRFQSWGIVNANNNFIERWKQKNIHIYLSGYPLVLNIEGKFVQIMAIFKASTIQIIHKCIYNSYQL